MSHPPATKPRPASGDDGTARSPGARPQLLDQIPASVVTSPGFIAGGGVFVFLYGLVFFAAMSGRKPPEPEAPLELDPLAFAATNRVKADSTKPKAPAPSAPNTAAAPKPAENKPANKETSAPKPPPTPAPPKPSAAPPTAVAAATAKPAMPSPAAPKPKGTPAQGKSAPAKTAKAEVAVNRPPTVALPTIAPLGPLIDPLGDCTVQAGGGGVTIVVPPKLHIFDPDRGVVNAPRALTEVAGDFVALVTVAGNIRPGTKPLENLPFTFQGAGLLLWQDPDNYVRVERAASYSGDRGAVSQILLESRKDGKPGRGVLLNVRDATLTLRMERHGVNINCTYTSDGKTWLPIKNSALTFLPKVSVGISASNASARPFPARFEAFKLSNGQDRAG